MLGVLAVDGVAYGGLVGLFGGFLIIPVAFAQSKDFQLAVEAQLLAMRGH